LISQSRGLGDVYKRQPGTLAIARSTRATQDAHVIPPMPMSQDNSFMG
jgi:hypothetical protein